MIGNTELAYGLTFVDPEAPNPMGIYSSMDHNPPSTHAAIFRAGQVGVARLSWEKKQMLVLVEQLHYVIAALNMWQFDNMDLDDGENPHFAEAHQLHIRAYRLVACLEGYLGDVSMTLDPDDDTLSSLHPIYLQREAITALKEYDRFTARYHSEFALIDDAVSHDLTRRRVELRMHLNSVLH